MDILSIYFRHYRQNVLLSIRCRQSSDLSDRLDQHSSPNEPTIPTWPSHRFPVPLGKTWSELRVSAFSNYRMMNTFSPGTMDGPRGGARFGSTNERTQLRRMHSVIQSFSIPFTFLSRTVVIFTFLLSRLKVIGVTEARGGPS